MNKTIQNGLIAGVLGIIFSMVAYFIQPKLILNIIPWVNFAIVLFFMYKSVTDAKKTNGGFISLKDALKHAWVPAIIAGAILLFFRFILFNFIDPSLLDLQVATAMKQAEKISSMFGQEIDFDEIEDMEEMMRENSKLTLSKTFLSILVAWILHFIPAIIMAAIMKKKRAEF